jgi:hypothetical protein
MKGVAGRSSDAAVARISPLFQAYLSGLKRVNRMQLNALDGNRFTK